MSARVEEFRKIVVEEEKKGNVVFQGIEGLMGMPVKEIIKQPTEGLLYDLNRDKATILTNINAEDQYNKWVNDYAVAVVIGELKARIAELEALTQWQPIETAKDGDLVVLFGGVSYVTVGIVNKSVKKVMSLWTPIPKSPEEK